MKPVKLTIFSIIFILCTSLTSKANAAKTNIEIGVNCSTLRNEDSKSEPGLCFGIHKDFYPIRSFNGYFGFGLNYARREIFLENITWPSNFFIQDSDIVYGNMKINIQHLNLPIKVGYHLFKSKTFSINVYSSYMLNIPFINDNSHKRKREIQLSHEERRTFDFDYTHADETSADIFFSAQVGFMVLFHKFGFGCRYEKAQGETDCSSSLVIRDEMDSIQMLFHIYF